MYSHRNTGGAPETRVEPSKDQASTRLQEELAKVPKLALGLVQPRKQHHAYRDNDACETHK